MFFGGEEIVPELSESGEQQGRHLLVLYLASITFSLAIAGRGRLNVHCTADFIGLENGMSLKKIGLVHCEYLAEY